MTSRSLWEVITFQAPSPDEDLFLCSPLAGGSGGGGKILSSLWERVGVRVTDQQHLE